MYRIAYINDDLDIIVDTTVSHLGLANRLCELRHRAFPDRTYFVVLPA